MERSTQNKKHSKSMNTLHLADMEELSSALEKFHYENETCIQNRSRLSESPIGISLIFDSDTSKDSDTDVSIEAKTESPAQLAGDGGLRDISCLGSGIIMVLEQKIDKLSDLFIEQSELLAALKHEIQYSNHTVEQLAAEHGRAASDFINLALARRLKCLQIDISEESAAAGLQAAQGVNCRAKALLDALEYKQKAASIDAVIRTTLTEFLQSDELKDHMVAATMGSIQQVVQDCLSRDVLSSYLPVLERSHRRLLKQVSSTFDDAFKEMEENAVSFSRSSYKSTRTMRLALERHQRLLEESAKPTGDTVRILKSSVRDVLQKELQQWRGKILNMLAEQQTFNETASSTGSLKYMPSSPPQPAEPGRSAIDQLMKAAEINVQMKEGDVNGSFEKALLASELPLVMAACRAADPAVIFAAPCKLKQHVLLSLVQQLATDMVHDTQLKCRYMEDAIMNLETENPVTRQHLPIVFGELCNHLSSFLSTFPGHMSSRRIKMLIMAASSLLKDIGGNINISPKSECF